MTEAQHTEAYNIQCLIGMDDYDNIVNGQVFKNVEYMEFIHTMRVLNSFNKTVAENI